MIDARWHPTALNELRAEVAWYKARDASAAKHFSEQVVAAVLRVRKRPHGRAEFEPGLFRCRVQRFPFSIIYRLREDRLEVLAVAHHKRKPGYWRKRTTSEEL